MALKSPAVADEKGRGESRYNGKKKSAAGGHTVLGVMSGRSSGLTFAFTKQLIPCGELSLILLEGGSSREGENHRYWFLSQGKGTKEDHA